MNASRIIVLSICTALIIGTETNAGTAQDADDHKGYVKQVVPNPPEAQYLVAVSANSKQEIIAVGIDGKNGFDGFVWLWLPQSNYGLEPGWTRLGSTAYEPVHQMIAVANDGKSITTGGKIDGSTVETIEMSTHFLDESGVRHTRIHKTVHNFDVTSTAGDYTCGRASGGSIPDGQSRGFISHQGNVELFNLAGKQIAWRAVNQHGVAVGCCWRTASDVSTHTALIYLDNKVMPLSKLVGGRYTNAIHIDKTGTIVANSTTGDAANIVILRPTAKTNRQTEQAQHESFSDFINRFMAHDLTADQNGDGVLDSSDLRIGAESPPNRSSQPLVCWSDTLPLVLSARSYLDPNDVPVMMLQAVADDLVCIGADPTVADYIFATFGLPLEPVDDPDEPAEEEDYNPDNNYCGGEGGSSWPSWCFNVCCFHHDDCYGNCEGRSECDTQVLACMIMQCAMDLGRPQLKRRCYELSVCKSAALTRYLVIRAFGHYFYPCPEPDPLPTHPGHPYHPYLVPM